jgi:hypothetical protein
MAKMLPLPHPIPTNPPPNQYHPTIDHSPRHPVQSAPEIPINYGCLRDELLSPPSHQQNGDDPSAIRAPIRLHLSPDTRLSRPLHQSNANRNV